MQNISIDDDVSEFSQYRQVDKNKTGRDYKLFVRSLKQKYWVVWRDIALGYFALLFTLSILCFVSDLTIVNIVITLLGAISIGFWIHYLTLFIHEAAHHNIAKGAVNDRLATFFLCWFAGVDITKYRRTHFKHHRLHGTCADTENSYFNAPTPQFLLKALLGIHAVNVLISRKNQQKVIVKFDIPIYLLFILFVHIALLVFFYLYFPWTVFVAWVFGLLSFFPFFASIRQILEHRDIAANPAVDYYLVPHGSFTRVFGKDIFSATFGAAGFNRHLIHHWEPNVPYTSLAKLEDFLLSTNAAPLIEMRRSSYWIVFKNLVAKTFDRKL